MKKLIACSSVVVLLFASAQAFALPKVKRVKIAGVNVRVKNAPKTITRAGKLRYARPKASQVAHAETASHIRIPGVIGRIGNRAKEMAYGMKQRVERAVTRAEQTADHVRTPSVRKAVARGGEVEEFMAALEKETTAWRDAGGKPFYDNSLELVRDIANFYGPQGGEAYLGILNEEVIVYPVLDFIIYHPKKNFFPRVLDPQKECILYYPATHTGQVLPKHLLSLFKKVE